jgi:hypothetical protein
VIYLEGGGACFNQLSCATNPKTFGAANFGSMVFDGILGVDDPANPVGDASFVYVPYCTGDVHAGSAAGASVPRVDGTQDFVGHDNVAGALERIVPTFEGVEQVILTGISAGGFGTWLNYEQVADAFCRDDVVLLSDSGPPQAAPFLASCLQQRWLDLWGLAETLPAGCTDCSPEGENGGVVHLPTYLSEAYPDARFGLVSSLRDNVIGMFFAFGLDECAAIDAAGLPDTTRGVNTFEEGLVALRDDVLAPLPGVTSYFLTGVKHTWTGDATWAETTSGEVLLVDWVRAVVEGPIPDAVNPAPAAP